MAIAILLLSLLLLSFMINASTTATTATTATNIVVVEEKGELIRRTCVTRFLCALVFLNKEKNSYRDKFNFDHIMKMRILLLEYTI